ncbi:putative zinc finger protein [Cercophora scortea]|uniref:Zinc finger protein n=1 Tax=Cercophora scortea TaxID=314031 RepID=A0AAE0I3I1_9PEZI|nr:putative zinc finger protein [Cercophora scortea]
MGVNCGVCGTWFATPRARDQHAEAKGHWQYECDVCYDVFGDEQEREHHHVHDHHYCSHCDRSFQNLNNIKMHLNSSIHRGQNINCPSNCGNAFTTAAGATAHLETGACPNAPGVSRDDVYRLIRSKDPNSVISKKLIGWYGSETYEATNRTWNGPAYECYLCDRTFSRLASLNQHLQSPAHQQDLYHCPNRGCAQEFKTLAALINHLESESCGFMRFDAVQKQMSGLVSSNRLIGF